MIQCRQSVSPYCWFSPLSLMFYHFIMKFPGRLPYMEILQSPQTMAAATQHPFPRPISWACPDPELWASLVAHMVKNLPAMQETQIWSLGWEDPLEKGMATPPVLLPGESHGQTSLVGYGPWGRKDSDTTEWLSLSLSCWRLLALITLALSFCFISRIHRFISLTFFFMHFLTLKWFSNILSRTFMRL